MKRARLATQMREHIDDRSKKWKPVLHERVPSQGWVREIREALGMSATQLGKRLSMSQQGVASLEKSEINQTIQIKTLRKVARQMSCHFVYALVPKMPLRKTLRSRAFSVLLPEVMLMLHKKRIKLPVRDIHLMIYKVMEQRRMLDDPRKLWKEVELPEEYSRLIDRQARRGKKPKANKMSEAEIALLPESIQDLAREGKVVG